jgi:hypothetical protein
MAKSRKRREIVAGIEMTDDNVDRLVEETVEAALSGKGTWHFPQRGRPSLTGKSAQSPHVGFRVSPELREQAAELARRRGISLSQLAREALEHYVAQ